MLHKGATWAKDQPNDDVDNDDDHDDNDDDHDDNDRIKEIGEEEEVEKNSYHHRSDFEALQSQPKKNSRQKFSSGVDLTASIKKPRKICILLEKNWWPLGEPSLSC